MILEREDKAVKHARVAVGAAFPVQRRIKGAEEALTGKRPDDAAIAAAGAQAAREMIEITGGAVVDRV